MSAMELKALASLAPALSAIPWAVEELHDVASAGRMLRPARNDDLIESDAALVRAYWALLTLLDPAQYAQYGNSFPYLYRDARERLSSFFEMPKSEVAAAALRVARFVAFELERYQGKRDPRSRLDRGQRAELVAASGAECRCWYCGYRFPAGVAESFINATKVDFHVALYVDFVTPRGMHASDLRIEVDHVQPLAAGGLDDISNMHLSCGWCNRAKSSLRLLFESTRSARSIRHPTLGYVTIPLPFWSVRVRAARRRCEHINGCDASLETTELVVAPWRTGGAMVPGNLAVFCSDHDPLEGHRLVPRRHMQAGLEVKSIA